MKLKNEIQQPILAWAQSTPLIRRVWVYGSHARGTPSADSALDIAVELEPVPDSEETLPVWIANSGKWQSQLQRDTALTVDLDWFDPDGSTLKLQNALSECGILIYERQP
jgi:predicted nucleotidyltransferase